MKTLRLRAVIRFDGLFGIELPTYRLHAGSMESDTPALIDKGELAPNADSKAIGAARITALADVPEEILNEAGDAVDIAKLRAHYAGIRPWCDDTFQPRI